jgi:hypothetical protein
MACGRRPAYLGPTGAGDLWQPAVEMDAAPNCCRSKLGHDLLSPVKPDASDMTTFRNEPCEIARIRGGRRFADSREDRLPMQRCG